MYYHLFCNLCPTPLVGFTCSVVIFIVYCYVLHVHRDESWTGRHVTGLCAGIPTGVFALVLSHFIALSKNFIQCSFCVLHVSM